MNRDNYMTTGEFAKVMGVTKNTLFHYDSIGLFSPEIVMDNEYRYYSIYQMELFDTILLLKKLGMSLSQIRSFLDHRSPDQFLSVFQKQEEQIDFQIKQLRKQKQWIKEQKSKITEICHLDLSAIYRKQYVKRYYLYMPVEEKTDAAFFKKTNQIIMDFLEFNPESNFDIGYLQRKSDIIKGVYDNYQNIILITQSEPAKMDSILLDQGDYLVAYHKGHWETIGECYERIFSYAKEHALPLDDICLEYYIVDNLLAEDFTDYVTEVCIKIVG